MIASTALRNAVRVGSRRPMSTASAPKTHMAKDVWPELQKTRPPPGHDHTVFEPPYNTAVVAAGVVTVITTGYGMMYFGMRHQQYKQGYWK
mmetsp:Transcript_23282/g.39797  ORF Transcript_23282/g.39797 Transcript_23282/m.39797 type:complete len:91 (-) Transcript_23282:249-521(-)|eukprot:CAMPEP_0183728848 /NCGR_PEP_ID=MMETSP0737-20130205/29046_1 /TAXON_ID=385413 /ORGANISM="Thalassiosira miniscula, Strain CCMP1093" /LENGTH=90 /DNA_ID=CAMNT_0025960885 /DNA_START=43 /DNA_END=315 /DNA_ORIENTATION=-